MFTLIDGKAVAEKIRGEVKDGVSKFREEYYRDVALAVVMVGDNAASEIYVRNKVKACEETGIKSLSYRLPATASQEEVEKLILDLSEDKSIDGILVQLPLPTGLDSKKILSLIPCCKDVDGFSPENIGKLSKGQDTLIACTPYGVIKLLEHYNVPIAGKNAVVVGRSDIVGKPLAMLLINADATVTVCHSKTRNLAEITRNADILIAAVGRAKMITSDMIKEGAVVIDVGMNRDENGKLCGDVDFAEVKNKCSHITPVPGGVGPMTITMLLSNTLKAAKRREGVV